MTSTYNTPAQQGIRAAKAQARRPQITRRYVTILADRESMTGVTSDDRLVCFSEQKWRWIYEDGTPIDRVIVAWVDEH